ncbi:unnamed protein product [Peronospora farinosa]|uniref:Reverse transcriptase zinc-binding domain-containing protein n=1 Tax=Peronospora farinosa TaxID=134698 RepID=A0ABN8BZY9_9STRA|nr:unnamed protein product [Peronospora farinosa]
MSPANRGKRLRVILLPIFEDLQCRLMLRLLPVRSRFWFLKATIPNIRHCVRNGCGAIETEQHLFFGCTLASELWSHVLGLATTFFPPRPVWLDIALARPLHACVKLNDGDDVVSDVGHVLRTRRLYSAGQQILLCSALHRLRSHSTFHGFVNCHAEIFSVCTPA